MGKMPDQSISYLEKEGRNWIIDQRDAYWAKGLPLDSSTRNAIEAFFHNDLLNKVRICKVPQIENPPFYKELEAQGISLLNFSDKDGVTFIDTILIVPSKMTPSLVFHECVHVAQYLFLGVDIFTHEYITGWENNKPDYYKIPLEAQAYQLEEQFDSNQQTAFSVEKEVEQKWSGIKAKK
jgi:hypothetical protein